MNHDLTKTHCTLQLLAEAQQFLSHVHEIALSHGIEIEEAPYNEGFGILYYAWKPCEDFADTEPETNEDAETEEEPATDSDMEEEEEAEEQDESGYCLSSTIALEGNKLSFLFDCWFSENWDGDSIIDYRFQIIGKTDPSRELPTIWTISMDPDYDQKIVEAALDYFGISVNRPFKNEAEVWLIINKIFNEARTYLET